MTENGLRSGLGSDAVALLDRHRPGLAATSFLGRLDVSDQESLAELGVPVRIPRNQALVREGEAGGVVFVLLSACVKVTGRTLDGAEALLDIRVGGDLIGEQAAVDGGRRSATVTVCGDEPCVALAISDDAFLAHLAAHPAASVALAAEMSRRLRLANRRRIEFSGCGVKERTARVLAELALSHGRTLPRGGISVGTAMSQAELASLVGAAEPTIQRTLADLRSAGLISTGYRTLVIRDMAELRRLGRLPDDETPAF